MTGRHLLAFALGALLVVPGTAAAATRSQPVGVEAAKPYFDSRTGARSKAARAGTTVAAARPSTQTRAARGTLERRLGRQGVLNIDPLTGTPRQLLRTDGALSGPRGGARADIAQDFVRANSTALGLDAADLDGLDLQRRATTPGGLTVVHFRQLYRGIPAFDNDLRVAIDRAGRVVSVAGAPRNDLAVDTVEPSISGAEALARLQRNVGVERSLPVRSGPTGARQTTTFEGGDFARLVLFGAAAEAKLAWHVTYRATSTAFYDAVVDATSGAILFRQNLTKAVANAEVYPNHPSDSAPVTVDLETLGLPADSTGLDGEYSRQWADLDDDDDHRRGRGDDAQLGHGLRPSVHRPTSRPRSRPARPRSPAHGTRATPARAPRPARRTSSQNGVQAFYLVSRFHDHLESAPIGFTSTSGNFEKAGGDAVLTQTSDGATIAADVPDGDAPQQRQHDDAARRAAADDADVPVPGHQLAERPRLAQHERRRRLRPRVARVHARALQPPRDQRRRFGRPQQRALRRDGRGLERLVRLGPAGPRGAQDRRRRDARRDRHRRLHRRRPAHAPHPGARLPRQHDGPALPRWHGHRGRRLHARRLRQDLRRPGGARRRRDLGRDAVGPAPGGRLRRRRDARDQRHAALAARAVDARHAQLDPGRRAGQRRRAPRRGVGGLPRPRHGLPRLPCPTATTPSRSRTSRCRPTPPAPRGPRRAS